MIVKMNKVFLVVMDAHREDTLKKLKNLGVLHINKETKSSVALQTLEERRARVERCLFMIPPVNGVEEEGPASLEEILDVTDTIQRQAEELRQQEEVLGRMEKDAERLEVWGDFSPEDILALREKGVDLRLFALPRDKVPLLEGYPIFPIHKTKTVQYLAAFIPEKDIPGEISEQVLPERGADELARCITEKREEVRLLRAEIKAYSRFRPTLERTMRTLDDSIEFETVRESFSGDSDLIYLSGFIPVSRTELLKKGAEKNGWALLITEPSEEDQVPTLVENNRVIRIIQPIFKLLGTTPGYHEYDISLWFLVFFSIFFAMIIGDAGYGVVFLLLTLFVRIKSGKGSDIIRLLLLLSGTTIVWGAITGTWFGSAVIAETFPFSLFVIEPIASLNPVSGETIKMICFIIGTVHLSLAHVKNFIKKLPRITAFADLGWLVMILGLYYLVLNLVLDPIKYPLPMYALYMIIGGLAGVIVFSQQGEGVNFFKGVLRGVSGLLTTFLDSISAFSDIISYIRLYAVGLATVAIAQSFNQMAAGLGSGIVALVGGAVILAFGHTLNLVMGALSVIVHGVRLNMLEFSGHLGMEWTGISYEPFRDKPEK